MQESAYSAFGSTSPIHDAAGERIRWFCPWVISGPTVLRNALDQLASLEGRVSVSRVTARVVSAGNLSTGCLELLSARGFNVEASASMSGAGKLVITYIGKCASGRSADADDALNEKSLLDCILSQDRKTPARILAEFELLDRYRIQTAASDDLSSADIECLVRMHNDIFPTFPYEFRRKLGIMLRNPEKYPMVIVRSVLNGQICAFSNLELNTVQLDDGTRLCLAEYDNTMRKSFCPDHGAVRGLGRILRLQLARLAVRNNADLCHAESRAGAAAINSNSHQVGMRFGGTLEKHLLISGRSDVDYKAPSSFETMNVWYFNREDLLALEAESNAAVQNAGLA